MSIDSTGIQTDTKRKNQCKRKGDTMSQRGRDETRERAAAAIMLVLMIEAKPEDQPETVKLQPKSRAQLVSAAAELRGLHVMEVVQELDRAAKTRRLPS